MSKRIFYKYNPETDNFERFYPTMKERLVSVSKICLGALIIAALFVIIFNYIVATPNEKNLRAENKRLKSQYSVMSSRLENMVEVIDKMEERDDNFYRVMMQLDPMSDAQRFSGYDYENRYSQLSKLSDSRLVEELSNRMNLLEKRIYSQLLSFDQLEEALTNQQDRLAHVPSVIPINIADYTMSSGYGYRVDPIYGSSKFHEGLDFAASQGTDVFATGDGKVVVAGRQAGYGNCIDIEHGYNYLTRYAHLSQILVKPGEEVKRGQLIGKVGSTGKSTGPHLHYEVRYKNIPQNPVNYYFMDLTPEEYYEMIQIAENAGHVMD
ncbi:MAG: M23 family metallopeptidase [Muribaculaceae bacterium]|nr:M23 family metallopeptidase [Muribaculaceae bacterium]